MNLESMVRPALPAVPGLRFRPFQGAADFPAIAEVMNASEEADLIEETITPEQLANEYAHSPEGSDVQEDVRLVEVAGQVVGYVYVWLSDIEGGERLYRHRGYLKPAWRRQGIGRAMWGWAETRLQAIAAARQDESLLVQVVAEDTAYGRAALAEQHGYHPARYFYFMQRTPLEPLPEAPLPPGVELRPARPEHLRAIWEAKDEAFADHWGHLVNTEADYQRWANDPSHDLSLWQVAWAGERVAGLSLNGVIEADNAHYGFLRGWINTLGVRRAWRGRGLARTLLVNGLQALRERGMTEAVLGVDAENLTGATRLYESVGFKVLNKDAVYRKRVSLSAST